MRAPCPALTLMQDPRLGGVPFGVVRMAVGPTIRGQETAGCSRVVRAIYSLLSLAEYRGDK